MHAKKRLHLHYALISLIVSLMTIAAKTSEELYGKEKPCTKCKRILPISKFAGRGKKSSIQLQSHCRDCQLAASIQYQKRAKSDPVLKDQMRKESLRNLRKRQNALHDVVIELKGNPCMDCQGIFHPCAMDFDHREGEEKTDHVARLIWRCRPIEEILEEIKKCDLVCSNCHRVRTYKRMLLKKEKI